MRKMARIGAVVGLCVASCAQAQSTELAQKLEKAARSGNGEASYHLGMLYNNGIGVAQDAKRAFAHFTQAADAGDPLGAYKVGCYYAGQFEGVVAVDEEQALGHKLKAAEAGYKLAQVDVGIAYARREDYGSALKWFEAAARQGDAQSLYNLSVFYKDGLGAAPSRPKSYAFFRLAHIAARGSVSEGAQKQLDEMAAAMNPQERSEAQRIAASWVTGPTPLTRLAAAGLDRAQAVAGRSR
jgi:TPR repeat protein